MTERDERLGSALLELEVPEHRPAFYDDLAGQLERRSARSRVWLLAPATALAAGVAVALAVTLTRSSEVASAASVRAAVEHAFMSDGSLSGVFVYNGTRWRFVTSSTGAYRIEGPTPQSLRVYDPAKNVESTSDASLFVRRVGLAPGPPDAGPANFVMQRALGSVVAALAAARDPRVEEVTYAGRPAWLLRTATRLVTVDRETGVPIRNQALRDGTVTSEWRIQDLEVSSDVPTIEPLQPGSGQTPLTYDAGFRRISPADAPLVPEDLPAGFEPARAAFAENSRPTGEEGGGNPTSRDVVSLSYRRGFDEIVVTTRRTGASPDAWKDPLQVSTIATNAPEQVTFTDGALQGRQGHLVLEPDALPHIWAVTPAVVVTIAGNVTSDELLQVANSLALR
jgi:hypothetical protein